MAVVSSLSRRAHPPPNPTVMPGTGAPPATIVKVKEAMTSTSEKILRLRSARCRVFRELITDHQYALKGIVWEMWIS